MEFDMESFKQLASDNGRQISCKIQVGNEVYYDDSILKFDFTDVTHGDYFTVGTTCSNEFSFTVMDYVEPALHTSVYAYISFDGGLNWFRLGIFYVAKRYFRGRYATFVCYDKMSDLNVTLAGNVPSSASGHADTLLAEVCRQGGITFNGTCGSFKTYLPHPSTTLREIIGYIAALHCACAKFDRNGELIFIKYSEMPTEILHAKNCMKIRRYITRAEIKGLRSTNDLDTLRWGSRDRFTTLEIYNPYMTQEVLSSIGEQLSELYFYGAEVEMQGLPYLEAGRFILLEDADESLTPIVISEIKYHYDGGLTAKLFSRNKEDADPEVKRSEFEKTVADILEMINQLKTKS